MEYLSDKSELTENSLDCSSLSDYMSSSKYVKCVTLSGLLGLFAMMISAVGDFQNHAFAQITPAPEKYGGSSSDQSSSNNPSSDGDDSGGSNDSDSSESSNSDDDSESQDIGSSEEEQDTPAEESTDSDSGNRSPLMEQIINKVEQDFAAVGLPSLDW